MRTLLIAEFLDELKTFVAANGLRALSQNGIYICAIRPEVQAHLRRLNVSYLTSLDFFDKGSHERLLIKSDSIIQSFKKLLAIEDDMGIKEGYNNTLLFYVRCFIHYILFLIEVIDRCVEQLKIDRVVAPYFGAPVKLSPLVGSEYRYSGQISELICKRRAVQFEHLFVGTHNRNKRLTVTETARHITGLGKSLIFLISLQLLLRFSEDKSIILSSSSDYNMSSLMEALCNRDKNILAFYFSSKRKWHDIKAIITKKGVWNLVTLADCSTHSQKAAFTRTVVANMDRVKTLADVQVDLLSYRGVNFSKQVLERIRHGLAPLLVAQYGQTVCLDRVLRRCRPKMIVVPHSREITYNLGELARRYRIPSLLVSHGSHVPPRNAYERIEWSEHGGGLMNTHYEYAAIQTPWAREYVKEIPTRSETIITGPLLFGQRVRSKVPKSRLRMQFLPGREGSFIILHASTPKTREVMRFYVYETVDEYIANINDLIRAVEKVEKAYLILRFRPLPDLNEQDFARLLRRSGCYGIYSHGSFADYLMLSDLLVSYSSTAIEEALQNDVPVLQYDRQGKYCHVPATLLKREEKKAVDSCYFVDSEDDLAWALKWIARHHQDRQPKSIFDRHKFKKSEITPIGKVYNTLVCT
jgi:hypothetical protein